MKYFKFIVGLVFITSFISCDEELCTCNQQSDYIVYGTSFGECLGYCIRSITITDNVIKFEKSGWEIDGSLPDVKESVPLDTASWNNLVSDIDFNAFFQLDSIIGCPDCADGGAEWIEIRKDGNVHRSTFEYMNEPEAVKEYIAILRDYLGSFE